jgi:quercetin dioxygenase-like cupin family protein
MEKLSWDGIAEQQLNESVTRRMFWGRNVMVTRWELAPGTTFPAHDHVSEQVTMVQQGSVTLSFPEDGTEYTITAGEMLVIPAWKPHGVKVGPEGCPVIYLFSPIRQDFIEGNAAYLPGTQMPTEEEKAAPAVNPYDELHGYLAARGIRVPIDELRKMPLNLLARYVYEREGITMGQLRKVLGFSKDQAKALLREWKHGDDHSESSLKKIMATKAIIPEELMKLFAPKEK